MPSQGDSPGSEALDTVEETGAGVHSHNWLVGNTYFQSLSQDELSRLEREMSPRVFAGGEILCRQGDASRGLFVVIAGRLEAVVDGGDGSETVVGEVGPGELFGEIGLITDEPRSATGRAIRDTLVLELPQDAWRRLAASHVEIVTKLTRLIVQRLKSRPGPRARSRGLTIAVLPLSAALPGADFARELRDALPASRTAALVSREDVAALDDAEAIVRLSQAEQSHDFVFLTCDPSDQEWTRRCLRQADRVLQVADVDGNPALQAIEAELREGRAARLPRDIVLATDDTQRHVGKTLHWLTPRTFQNVYFVPVNRPGRLASLATALVERHLGESWLQHTVLFSSMTPEDARPVIEELESVRLSGQDVLFQKGDPGDGVFLVVSGRLQAVLLLEDGKEKVLGEMGPGDVVGEISLLTGEARTATVRAIRDSRLLKLTSTSFNRLARGKPELVFQLARTIVDRLSGRPRKSQSARSVNFAVVCLSHDLDPHLALQDLQRGFATLGRTAIIGRREVQAHLGDGTADIDRDAAGDSLVVDWLNQKELENEVLLYQCDFDGSAWTERCLRQADRILLVGRAGSSPGLSPFEQRLRQQDRKIPVYLILRHPDVAREGSGTALWLEPRAVRQHFHAREDNLSDWSRIARMLAGRGCGLALGGGGSRGVAHIGVYRAMQEAGLPVDFVAGASAGAAVAGLMALGDDPVVALWKIQQMLTRPLGHLLSFGPPLVSLMSGRYVQQLLKPLFGDARLEDQFVPCVIVATDLVTGDVCPLTHGKIDEAVRASSSLPGAWPPVVSNGRFLVDGGVMNNLPIDVVKAACPKGPVVAVDISGSEDYSVYEPYGQELSGWKVLRQMVWPFGRKPRLPSIMNVISRCCTLSSSSRQQQMLKDDRLLYLPLPVTKYGMFDIRTPEVVTAVEQCGYEFARERIQTWVPAPAN